MRMYVYLCGDVPARTLRKSLLSENRWILCSTCETNPPQSSSWNSKLPPWPVWRKKPPLPPTWGTQTLVGSSSCMHTFWDPTCLLSTPKYFLRGIQPPSSPSLGNHHHKNSMWGFQHPQGPTWGAWIPRCSRWVFQSPWSPMSSGKPPKCPTGVLDSSKA